MKKTKTGLHIETRKNRIEVYTKKDLKQMERTVPPKNITLNIKVNDKEKVMGLDNKERLACQCSIKSGIVKIKFWGGKNGKIKS